MAKTEKGHGNAVNDMDPFIPYQIYTWHTKEKLFGNDKCSQIKASVKNRKKN